jgi:hypothetical protein
MVLAHRAEKWFRFSLTRTAGSALNDAPAKKTSIGWIPKVASTFGSDAPANLPSESHTLAQRGGPAALEGT